MAALGERNLVARWQRQLLDGSLGLLLISGAAWLALHYGTGGDEGALPSPIEPWLIRLHGLAAFAVLIAFGAFLPAHVPRGWRMAARRGLETTLLAFFAVAIATAFALYYFAPGTIRPSLGWGHAAAGALVGVLVLVHRRRRRPKPLA